MMKFRENEDAVSPVIGVILMVAITVILAAVIAAFVFGMSGDLTTQKEVYVTTALGVDDTGNPTMTVTIQGGKDISALSKIQSKNNFDSSPEFSDVTNLEDTNSPFEVGDSGTIDLSSVTKGTTAHITIRGVFADGTVKILAERDYVGSKTTP